MSYISGTNQNDFLPGTEEADEIHAYYGSDGVTGNDGDDYIEDYYARYYYGDPFYYADGGNDTLMGGDNDDTVISGEGNDLITGDEGNDYLSDYIWGNGYDYDYNIQQDYVLYYYGAATSGNDTLFGGNGSDTIISGSGDDTINGGQGQDFIIDIGDYELEYGFAFYGFYGYYDDIGEDSGNDRIGGGSGHDVIYSGDGNDTLMGGSGDDYIYDFGAASYYAPDDDVLNGSDGNDTLFGGSMHDMLIGGTGNDHFIYDTYAYGPVAPYPYSLDYHDGGDDIIKDFHFASTQEGGEEEIPEELPIETQELETPEENDTLVIYTGTIFDVNTMEWGIASSRIVFEYGGGIMMQNVFKSLHDNIYFNDNTESRLVFSNVDQDVLIAGSDDSKLIGGEGAQHFIGGAGDDVLTTTGGDDLMEGGAGNDVFDIDNYNGAPAGDVLIKDFTQEVDIIDLTDFNIGVSFASFKAAYIHDNSGGDAVIGDPGHSITVKGVSTAELTASDFWF